MIGEPNIDSPTNYLVKMSSTMIPLMAPWDVCHRYTVQFNKSAVLRSSPKPVPSKLIKCFRAFSSCDRLGFIKHKHEYIRTYICRCAHTRQVDE